LRGDLKLSDFSLLPMSILLGNIISFSLKSFLLARHWRFTPELLAT
jgi:hypothetical protein